MKKLYNSKKFGALTLAAACSAILAGCAGGPSASQAETDIYDPLEPLNRGTLQFNEAVDKVALEPLARGYVAATPRGFRTILSNFLRNLRSPVTIGNEVLQGDFEGAGNASARAVINTLAGFGGILDLAEDGGIPHEPEDFGQTLAVWGVDDGFYIMLPVMGPSNARDTVGLIVDSYADPLRIYLFNIEEEGLYYTRVGAEILTKRAELLDVIDDLRRNSFDYYAAVRSAYYQNRRALINDKSGELSAPEIPEYDDF
jgi:phospholipid-binding lipoprotein MlaA